MGTIISVSVADYSANNLGQIHIPSDVDYTVDDYIAKIETFESVSDTIKDALYILSQSIEAEGLFSKIKSFYPMIGSTGNSLIIDLLNSGKETQNLLLVDGIIQANGFVSVSSSPGYIKTPFTVNADNYKKVAFGVKKTPGVNVGWLLSAESQIDYYGIGNSGTVGGTFGAVSADRHLLTNYNSSTTRHFCLVSNAADSYYPLDGSVADRFTDTAHNPSKPVIVGGAFISGSYTFAVFGTYSTIWFADALSIDEVATLKNIIDEFDVKIGR